MKYYTENPGYRITALRDEEFKDRTTYRRVWIDAMKLDPIIGSRRNWRCEGEKLDWLDGCFYFADGKPYRLTTPGHVVFSDCNRWWSEYRKADATGRRPRHYLRCYEKLRRTHLIIEVWKLEGAFPVIGANPPRGARYLR